jgi:hypothetical protein
MNNVDARGQDQTGVLGVPQPFIAGSALGVIVLGPPHLRCNVL